MYLCLAQDIITFVHYGFIDSGPRGYLDPLIDINKFHISFCLFYFYLDKASGLISNQDQVLRRLTIIFRVCCFLLYIFALGYMFKYSPETTEPLYIFLTLFIFKLIPIFLFIWELRVLVRLKPSHAQLSVDDQFKRVIMKLQTKRLRLLKCIFVMIIFLYATDILLDLNLLRDIENHDIIRDSHTWSIIIYTV